MRILIIAISDVVAGQSSGSTMMAVHEKRSTESAASAARGDNFIFFIDQAIFAKSMWPDRIHCRIIKKISVIFPFLIKRREAKIYFSLLKQILASALYQI
jgi:hypothetical protein